MDGCVGVDTLFFLFLYFLLLVLGRGETSYLGLFIEGPGARSYSGLLLALVIRSLLVIFYVGRQPEQHTITIPISYTRRKPISFIICPRVHPCNPDDSSIQFTVPIMHEQKGFVNSIPYPSSRS